MLRPFKDKVPWIGPGAYVDHSAQVIGDVCLGARSSIWMNAVVRGDVHSIRLGELSNIQDLCMAHVTHGTHPLVIGDRVTLGHHAVVHGCTIGNSVLVGIAACVLDGAVIEDQVVIGAGSLVTPNCRIPSGHLALGTPAKVVRELRPQELDHIQTLAHRYADLSAVYAQQAQG